MAGMFSYVNRLISGNNVESTLIEAATSGDYVVLLIDSVLLIVLFRKIRSFSLHLLESKPERSVHD
jgi:hypothetical protein